MKGRIRAFIAATVLSAAVCCSLGGCAVRGGLSVESVTHIHTDEGTTKVVITYSDQSVAPTVFYIPDGAQGAGIADVSGVPNAENTATVVTISYTDGRQDSVFSLPYGTFISGVTSSVDADTGDTYLTINFSDDSLEPYTVKLPAGKDGEDGSEITSITSVTDPITGETTVNIVYDDGKTSSFVVPGGKDGENGVGIEKITVNEQLTASDPDNIYLDIFFTDGESQRLTIPKTNRWLIGEGEPSPSLGNVGDYYTDRAAAKIYLKSADGGWSVLFDFSDYSKQRHVVRLVVDGITFGTETIAHGFNFYSSSKSLPLPEKEGYEFVGWYTAESPTINDGRFDNLTYVLSDITLYAQFKAV